MARSKKIHTPEVYSAGTDVGCVREHNEDSFIAQSPVFVVADGMGGHEAGEVASEIAVDTILQLAPDGPDWDRLLYAVKQANRAVIRGAASGLGRPGMGCTVTCAMIYDDQMAVAQVGDSRAYLLHNGKLQRITRDHSLVGDLVARGQITEEQARTHPHRSVITRALGSDPATEADLYVLRVAKGDRVMLCSDGLCGMVYDDEIEAIMRARQDVDECVQALIEAALAHGGNDNVTVVVVDPLVSADDAKSARAAGSLRSATMRGGAHSIDGFSAVASPRKNKRAPILWAVVVIAVLVLGMLGVYAYAQSTYNVTYDEGYVCIYRGLPGNLGPIKLNWLEEKTDVKVSDLTAPAQARLQEGISVDSLQEAKELIGTYRNEIALSKKGQRTGSDIANALDSGDNS